MDFRGKAKFRRLVAVVVTHNRLAQLRRTIDRLLLSDPSELAAVAVVDNASTDGTKEYLQALSDPRVSVLATMTNTGGAGGFEAGIAFAMETLDPEWLVLMDDDARPALGSLRAFHVAASSENQAMAAAVFYPDGRICDMNRPWVNPFRSVSVLGCRIEQVFKPQRRPLHQLPDRAYEAPGMTDVDLSSFVGMFIPRTMVHEVGLPDGRLFLYGDDALYALRLRRAGYRIKFVPSVRFEHDCTTLADDQCGTFHPIWKAYYNYRNGYQMHRRITGFAFWVFLPFLVLNWHLAGRKYGDQGPTHNRLLRRAIKDAVFGHSERSHREIVAMTEA